MNYQQTSFLLSAETLAHCPPDVGRCVAFAGRSNVGKSSIINTLTNQNNLARTSNTPGRTQLLNFFKIEDNCYLVDLPGYGFAKVSKAVQKRFSATLTAFFAKRTTLKGAVLIMDSRHPLKPLDWAFIHLAKTYHIPVHLILNKSDKLTRNELKKTIAVVEKTLENNKPYTLQTFSCLKHTGKETLIAQLDQWLQ